MKPFDALRHLPPDPTIPDAIALIESACELIGRGFHPDTPFDQYLNVENEERLFTNQEAWELHWEMVRAAELLAHEPEDAYELCERFLSDQALGVGVPTIVGS